MFGKLLAWFRPVTTTTTRIYPVNAAQGALWRDIAVAAGYRPSFQYTQLADTRMFYFDLHVDGVANPYEVRRQIRDVIFERYADDPAISLYDNGVLTIRSGDAVLQGDAQPDGLFVMAALPPACPQITKPVLKPVPLFQ